MRPPRPHPHHPGPPGLGNARFREQNPHLQLGTIGKHSRLGFFLLHTTEGITLRQTIIFPQPWQRCH